MNVHRELWNLLGIPLWALEFISKIAYCPNFRPKMTRNSTKMALIFMPTWKISWEKTTQIKLNFPLNQQLVETNDRKFKLHSNSTRFKSNSPCGSKRENASWEESCCDVIYNVAQIHLTMLLRSIFYFAMCKFTNKNFHVFFCGWVLQYIHW